MSAIVKLAPISHGAAVQRDGLGGVVVAGDHVVDAFWGVVRIDHTDQRNAQLLGFGHSDLVEAHVDDEDGIGQIPGVVEGALGQGDALIEP